MTLTPVPQSTAVPQFGNVIGENAYRILKNGSFVNGRNVVTDVFTDANGKNNCINTGLSSAVFSTDNYSLLDEAGILTDLPLGADAHKGGTFTTTFTAKKGFYLYTLQVRNYTGNNTGTITLKKNGVTIASKPIGSSNTDIYFNKTDYSDFWEAGDTCEIVTTITGGGQIYYQDNVTDDNLFFTCSGQDFPYYSYSGLIVQWKAYDFIGTTGTIVADANTKTLNGSESKFALFADFDQPAGTNITYDISDGTSTITGQQLGETIDISSLGAGTLKITLNLEADTLGLNPICYGFAGVFVE